MIIKGGSRARPSQLAYHLQRTDTNERIKILEIQSPHGNLTETFRDWQFLVGGTRGTKGLYHVNIDPDARYKMTPEQWQRSVDVLEKQLGLSGQPRAIVMHEKHGREHIHVVWQRTNIATMTLVSDSFNYLAHERASLALEKEFGHEIVPGKHAKRDRKKQPEFPRSEVMHDEWQQAERSGVSIKERKEAITALYEQS
ncbi:MAG TPA: relaxase/mobilization nuclease domain-containing protein, partial [Acidisoma sp.]|nr:relaxase/mobilization nuclease domain-containing protein [Acidisoma sp.]